MDDSLFLIYTTMPDYSTAHDVCDVLLKENLVVCVNMFDGMTSMYHWEGEIRTSNECVVIMKTTRSLHEAAMQKIKELHSYDIPAVFSIPVYDCNPEFLNWVISSVSKNTY